MFSLKTFFKKEKQEKESPQEKRPVSEMSFSKEYIPLKKNGYTGRCLAFSIDSSSIQMAVANIRSTSREIIDLRKVYIPGELLTTPSQREFITNTIEEFFHEYHCKRCRIVIALSGDDTAFRTTVMPSMEPKELATAIEFEVRNKIPFPPDNVIYDYRPIYKISSENNTRLKVVLLAATRTAVERNLAPFREHQRIISHVYHSPQVVGQLLKHLPEYNDEHAFTLLNIGRDASEIAFYRGVTLEFYHQINTGTSLIQNDRRETSLEYLAETLATDIQTAVDYYSGQYQTLSTDKVYIYGDLAYSPELVSLLNNTLGFKFLRFPFDRLQSLHSRQPEVLESAAVCLPVLASSICQYKLANLLPEEDKAVLQRITYHSYGRLSLAGLFIILAFIWGFLNYNLRAKQDIVTSLQREVAEFQNSDIYNDYNRLKQNIAIAESYLKQAKQNPSYLDLNLKELSILSPEQLELLQLDFSNDGSKENLQLYGQVVSDSIPPEVILAEYVERLNTSPFYEDVTLKRHVKRREADTFILEFQIGMRGII